MEEADKGILSIKNLYEEKANMQTDLGIANNDLTQKNQKIEQLEMKVALLELEKNKLLGENQRIQD